MAYPSSEATSDEEGGRGERGDCAEDARQGNCCDHKELPTDKKHMRVVQLQPIPDTMTGLSSSEDVTVLPSASSRPFAILLRFRVAEIVAGIVTILLGAVACLEDKTRLTLGMGIPAGILTVLAAVAHILATRRLYQTALLPTTTGSGFITATGLRLPIYRPLDALRPLAPTMACVLACLLLLALSCMAAGSHESNRKSLGCIQSAASLVVLATEASVWTYRWHWIVRAQIT